MSGLLSRAPARWRKLLLSSFQPLQWCLLPLPYCSLPATHLHHLALPHTFCLFPLQSIIAAQKCFHRPATDTSPWRCSWNISFVLVSCRFLSQHEIVNAFYTFWYFVFVCKHTIFAMCVVGWGDDIIQPVSQDFPPVPSWTAPCLMRNSNNLIAQ